MIDPVSAYLGATDSHKNGEVRGLLKPLADVAEKWGTAIVCVSHLNKGSKTPAMYRTMGSLAFVAAARVAWTIVRDRGDRDRMLMLPLKNNIAPDMGGMAYRVVSAESNPKVGAIEWEKFPVHDDVNDAMDTEGSPRSVRVEERQALEAILHDALRDGRKSIADLLDMTKEQGFSEARTRRALRKIKATIRSRTVRAGGTGIRPTTPGVRRLSAMWRRQLVELDRRCQVQQVPNLAHCPIPRQVAKLIKFNKFMKFKKEGRTWRS